MENERRDEGDGRDQRAKHRFGLDCAAAEQNFRKSMDPLVPASTSVRVGWFVCQLLSVRVLIALGLPSAF